MPTDTRQHFVVQPKAPASPYRVPEHLGWCPCCGGKMVQEPGASRCLMCARVFYVLFELAAQESFERASGLLSAQERVATFSERGVRGGMVRHHTRGAE